MSRYFNFFYLFAQGEEECCQSGRLSEEGMKESDTLDEMMEFGIKMGSISTIVTTLYLPTYSTTYLYI